MAAITSPAVRPLAPLRLTRRGRRLVAVILTAPVAAGMLLVGGLRVQADVRSEPLRTVVVQPGQSLWQIAQAVAPKRDPRATIHQIEQLNGMTGASVEAGTLLIVPASS